ncbi:sporozoite-associated mosquito saliva protein 1-like [Haematobia irritans]|uniref:sporozoite-associated mosquito saliva protein 1-like n=1 Tax=Haematobia irritans TaxID=7368 RepID=UPI003F504B6C
MTQILFRTILLIGVIQLSLACNGYKAKLLKVENCAGSDAVITIDEDFSVKLNKNCEIVPKGCIHSKAFTTAVSTYKVVKDGIPLAEGQMDLCSMADSIPDEAYQYIKMFGAPASCPVKEDNICGNDNKIDLSKYKSMLSLARGLIVVDSSIEHDTGKSCIHIEMELTK